MSTNIKDTGYTKPGFINLSVVNATTTDTNDSIKITGSTAALSADNAGYVNILGTDGLIDTYKITADVTIKLTGATWGNGGQDSGTTGDLSDAILRVNALNNNNASIIWGVSFSYKNTITDTNTNTTASSVTTPEGVLVNSAVTAGTWNSMQLGWVRATFDDVGATNNLWAVLTTAGSLNVGDCDGIWQTWAPVSTGATLSTITARWCQVGKKVSVNYNTNAYATGTGTGWTLLFPLKAAYNIQSDISRYVDNGGASVFGTGQVTINATDNTATLAPVSGTWTAAGNRLANFQLSYEAV